jgi:very-short-patch-repair endonuclease
VLEQGTADVNALQASVSDIEEQIRREVEMLSATRAWSHAVSPERLTGQARANLEHYAYLVRRLGKGKSVKYGAQRRAEVRQAMERCRPAVPVWIMPLYRIAEQFRIQPDMFDVVIVDEASQAGLEATFLQYLAPKMVVIGDDKQVSPTAVGVDQQQLRDLAGQYLADDPYRASWQDPQRSLFDEAKMRYSGLLTLTEHRRCMPEIISFSNRIAYEPEGIRLIPVRQYGADRLEPIKAVFLADGYARGSTSKVNPVEVDAVADQIEKCIADPRYDGLTFGVISLLGSAQAKAIEKKLLERVPPDELIARDLRCGDSADFQGSERDVMFLSMVAAPEPGKRLGTLSQNMYVQRYNVAASRAKDQMWLFHSVALSDLGNPEDMRFQLLDHCYGIINRSHGGDQGGLTSAVPEDRRVAPFDSLFEQRVFNRLVDRGYTVFPQYPAEPYRIDLVVMGAKSRLAIECDGDTWHGPDAYERDLARQRDLERCGWHFFRIRESAFYVDQAIVLEDLWARLRELDVHPSGWTSEETSEPAAAQLVVAQARNHTSVMAHDLGPELVPAAQQARLDDEDVADQDADAILETAGAKPVPSSVIPPVASGEASLASYDEFTGTLPSALDATKAQLIDGLRAIVAVEGPVLGHRLHSAYVKASGGQRVGKQIATTLNSAIITAVRRGLLVEDNPLGEPGVKPRTYRLLDQPTTRVRRLGPRPFEHIPPRELASILAQVAADHGWDSEQTLYRATLDLLGLKRLTANVNDRFRAVLPLARNG